MGKTVQVSYFAVLREKRGLNSEQCSTQAATLGEFYEELSARHGFGMPIHNLRVARNNEFCSWDAELISGDEVVFIPPVAGG